MNIPEMIMTILISIGIGKFSEYQSPKYYELETVDGNVYNVKVEKNHKYACPLHCKADHYHNVILTENEIDYELWNKENGCFGNIILSSILI